MRRPERATSDVWALQAGLKQLVTRLAEAELLLVRSWVEEEIRSLRSVFPSAPEVRAGVVRASPTPGGRVLRLVRTPDSPPRAAEEPSQPIPELFEGSFVELAGTVRKRLHDLPEDRLIVLQLWVDQRLRNRFGV